MYWDAGLPGFGVKVTPKGRKVFLVMYRLAGGRLTAAQVHDRPLRAGHASHGTGTCTEDLRCQT